MPHKYNADRRNKIPRQKHRVTSWAEYNEGLRRRGDMTVWIGEDVLDLWFAPRLTTRGGQPRYSDLAIELCLTLGVVFHQPLRQTQGFMRSIAGLLEIKIAVPDFSALMRSKTRQDETAILSRLTPMGGWPGKNLQATISAAASKHKWAAGKR